MVVLGLLVEETFRQANEFAAVQSAIRVHEPSAAQLQQGRLHVQVQVEQSRKAMKNTTQAPAGAPDVIEDSDDEDGQDAAMNPKQKAEFAVRVLALEQLTLELSRRRGNRATILHGHVLREVCQGHYIGGIHMGLYQNHFQKTQIAKRNPISEQALQSMTIPGLSNRHRSAYGADIVHALAAARTWVAAHGSNATATFELDVSQLPSTVKAAAKRRRGNEAEQEHATQQQQGGGNRPALAFDGVLVWLCVLLYTNVLDGATQTSQDGTMTIFHQHHAPSTPNLPVQPHSLLRLPTTPREEGCCHNNRLAQSNRHRRCVVTHVAASPIFLCRILHALHT